MARYLKALSKLLLHLDQNWYHPYLFILICCDCYKLCAFKSVRGYGFLLSVSHPYYVDTRLVLVQGVQHDLEKKTRRWLFNSVQHHLYTQIFS